MSRLILRSVLLCGVLLLTSCGGGGGSGISGLTVYITDAPIDAATSVNIGFSGVYVRGSGGVYAFPLTTITPDLYQLQGGVESYLVTQADIPPGQYTAISLAISAAPGTASSYMQLADGTLHPIYIPSGEPTTITVPFNFTIPSSGNANITIDFDLRKSLIQDPNDPTKFILRPVLRAVDNNNQGTISGIVNTALLSSSCSPTVYVYSGSVTPTDVDVNAPAGTVQPITSALVGLNVTTGQYNFTAAFLPPGGYTVAFTCEANLDQPDTADTIKFSSVAHATVTNNTVTQVNLN